jgi:dolichol-phosphate mannosyltransferase
MKTPHAPGERLVVLVPCFNEENNLDSTVADILAEAERIDLELVVVLVDDGSTDKTLEKMNAIAAADPRCHVIHHERNRGLGYSLLEGIHWARPDDWLVSVPGDNEFIFKSVHRMLEMRGEYDLVLGYFQNPIVRTLTRRVASAIFKSVTNFAYGWRFTYLNGMAIFRAGIFQNLKIESSGHAFGPEMVAKALLRNPLLRIGEAPFAARGRRVGGSKAFSLKGISTSVLDFARGYRSVSLYRDEVVSGESEQLQSGKSPGRSGTD